MSTAAEVIAIDVIAVIEDRVRPILYNPGIAQD